jgi:Skp family chaperone for outer membrane proteins
MKGLKLAVCAASVAVFAMISPAMAAEASYGVVNVNTILQTSEAAKGMFSELETKRKEFQEQITKEEAALRKSEQEILAQKDKISKEDFEKKRKEFETKVIAAQKSVQDRKQTLDQGFNEAMGKLRTEILKVAADVARGKAMTAVFNQEAMVLVDEKMDITKEVVEGVNKNVKKIPIDWKKK